MSELNFLSDLLGITTVTAIVILYLVLLWRNHKASYSKQVTLYKEGKSGQLTFYHAAWYASFNKCVIETKEEIGSATQAENWIRHPPATKKEAIKQLKEKEESMRLDGYRDLTPHDFIIISAEITLAKSQFKKLDEVHGYFGEDIEDELRRSHNGTVEDFSLTNSLIVLSLKTINPDRARSTLLESLEEANIKGAELSKFEIQINPHSE